MAVLIFEHVTRTRAFELLIILGLGQTHKSEVPIMKMLR
jgi:hypothetical protein